MLDELIVYVVDVGSVKKGNFIWVSYEDSLVSSSDPAKLAESIANDLKTGHRVALGYESPLFMPVDNDLNLIGKARDGEGNRAFNAGAGPSVLVTGIQTLAWVLREIKKMCSSATATTRWSDFKSGTFQLFIWEAFVSGTEKAGTHEEDARLAMETFRVKMHQQTNPTCIKSSQTFSLAGAAILWAELSKDNRLLYEPCVVLRPLSKVERADHQSGSDT